MQVNGPFTSFSFTFSCTTDQSQEQSPYGLRELRRKRSLKIWITLQVTYMYTTGV